MRADTLLTAFVACSSMCESFWSVQCSCLRASVARVPSTTAHRCQPASPRATPRVQCCRAPEPPWWRVCHEALVFAGQ